MEEVLLLCLLAILAGAKTIVDIARFDEKKRELLHRLRPLLDIGTRTTPVTYKILILPKTTG